MFSTRTNRRWPYLYLSGGVLGCLAAIVLITPVLFGKVFPTVHWGGLSIPIRSDPVIDYRKLGHSYGIAAGSNMTELSDSELQARVKNLADLGVTWVRMDIEWSNVQPQGASSYQWTDYDRVIRALRAQKLQVLAILDYTPTWARAPGCDSKQCPPRDPNEFASFARKAAEHYSSMGVHAWEVWNEPNNPIFWVPRADTAAYVALLKKAYPAIHNADPHAFVLGGGLSPQPSDGTAISRTDFLQQMYDNGAANYFDAVSDHPYTFPFLPSEHNLGAWAEMSATHTNLRGIMIAHGDVSKKIWITEYGAPTGGPGPVATVAKPDTPGAWHVTEDLQSTILNQAISLYKTYDWAGPFFWYSYKDAGTSSDSNENFFGIVRADDSHKPAYDAYSNDMRH